MKATWRRAIVPTILILLCPVGLGAQIEGPSLGFVLDPEIGAIRPILGIAGAATRGAPLDVGTRVKAVAFSPERDYVLAISNEGELLLVQDASRSPSVSRITGTWDELDRIGLSPTGSAAALIRGDVIQLIAGLPEEPYVHRTVALPSVWGSLTAVAVSDDAQWTLAAFSASGAVYLLEDNAIRPIAVFGHVSAMEFLNNRSDALIADDLYDEVYLVQDVAGSSGKARLASRGNGVSEPVDVRASADNQQFIVANAGSSEILLLDGVHSPTQIPCPCQPDRLYRLRGDAVFGLTDPNGPLWVFVGDRTFVIPPPPDREDTP